MTSSENMHDKEYKIRAYTAEDVDAPYALLSRIRAAKEARGERRIQGAAGQKIIKDFSKVINAEPGERVRRFSVGVNRYQMGGYSGPGKSARDPQGLSGILDRVIMERGWSTPVAVSSVLTRWGTLVGAQLASKSKPESFDDGVVVVRCESTAWAVEMRRMKYDIMRRINEELGGEIVKDIQAHGPNAPSWKKGRRVAPGGRGPRDTYG